MSDDDDDDHEDDHDAVDYPPPGVRPSDPDTSHAADKIVRARSGTSRLRMLVAYFYHGPLTADEVADITGLLGGCYWKRASELRLGGLIEDTGVRRKGIRGSDQMVCRITREGVWALQQRKDELLDGEE